MTDSYATWYLLTALISGVLGLLVYVWTALALGAVFAKLGVERWKAWVPFYNYVVLLGLGGLSGWLLLLLLIPVFGPVFVFVAVVTAAHRVNAMFGYGPGMTVLAALLFPVWASVLGFGAARPVHPVPVRRPAGGDDQLRSFSEEFDRGYGQGDDLSGRRSVPSPSAWIPPAPPAPSAPGGEAQPAPVLDAVPAPTWGEPYRAPATADAYAVTPAAPAAQAYAAPPSAPAASFAAPEGDAYVAPAAPAFPSMEPVAPSTEETVRPEPAPAPAAPPVMSWWQPAIVDETDDADDEPQAAVDLPDWARPVSSAPSEPADPAAPAATAAPAAPAAPPVPPAIPQIPAPSAAPAVVPAAAPTVDADPAPADPPAPVEPAAAAFAPPTTPRVLRESYLPESDAFPEASGEVSAVVGSPIAGPPRSASASVSAARPGVGDFVEDTVIASRRRPKWALLLPDGSSIDLTSDTVVLGRRPVPVHSAPGAQLVLVVDDTRTVSKTHAQLRRRADVWMIADLGSTNGVVVIEGETEIEVEPGADHEVHERFLLGDAELRLVRADG